MNNSIHLWGMGFTQSFGNFNGQIALWLKAREVVRSRSTILLTPFQWKANPKDTCELLRDLADRRTRIYGYFYSWGAGALYRRLVRHMENAGLNFEAVVLCDPVWRSRLMPNWLPFNPTSLLPLYSFKIPPNVRRVYVFHQNVNRPRGHSVIIEDPRTTLLESTVQLAAPHERMEDQLEYHNQVLDLVKESTYGRP